LRRSGTSSRSLDVHAILAPDTLSFALAKPIVVMMGIASTNYPVSPWRTLRFTETIQGRCLLPASATDLRHEHPQTVQFPGVRLSSNRPPIAMKRVQRDGVAYCFLAETEPQVDTRLTARFQLWLNRPRPCPKGKAGHRTGRCHLAAAFSTACKVVRLGL
jgi:hypothetical protein